MIWEMRKKTIIHISKLRFGQYFFLFDIFYYLKISLSYKSVNSQNKKNFALMRFRKLTFMKE